MSYTKESRLTFYLLISAIASGVFTIALGTVVLTGWYTGNKILVQVLPQFVPMQYNTALGFLLCGTGMLLGIFKNRYISFAIGILLILLGGLTLFEYIFSLNIGIDELFMKHDIVVKTSHPGRMAPNTASCFVLFGGTLLFSLFSRKPAYESLYKSIIASLIFAFSIVALSGYMTHLESAYGWGNLTRMAVHTSAGFVVLSIGLLIYLWRHDIDDITTLPYWLPVPIAIGSLTVTLCLWQAHYFERNVIVDVGSNASGQPYLLPASLVVGVLFSVALSFTFYFAMVSNKRAGKIAEVNRNLASEISERKASDENYQLLVSSVKDYAIFTTSPEGIMNSWNEGVKAIKGYEADEVIGKHISMLYPEEDVKSGEIEHKLQKAKEDGECEDEGWRIKKDGSRFWANVVITAKHDKNGILIGYTKVTRDFTDRKKNEESLIKYQDHLESIVEERTKELCESQDKLISTERLAVLGRLSSGIAHEIRNPLATIASSAYFLSKKLKDADEVILRNIKRIEGEVKESTAIIQGLQDLATMEKPNKVKRDVAVIIEECLKTSMIPEGVKVDMDIQKGEFHVNVDIRQMSIMYKNLINNAVQAMDNKGSLCIDAERAEDNRVVVSIRDSGHGIKADDLKNVFTPFFGTKIKGFGFGLSICQMIIEKHEGEIDVQSEEGKGATFTVRYPLN